MGMLIYVILRGLCFINEWNVIINLQNDMVKNIQNRMGKKSIDFGFEKVELLKWGSHVLLHTHIKSFS
jgi:hypothetical protein